MRSCQQKLEREESALKDRDIKIGALKGVMNEEKRVHTKALEGIKQELIVSKNLRDDMKQTIRERDGELKDIRELLMDRDQRIACLGEELVSLKAALEEKEASSMQKSEHAENVVRLEEAVNRVEHINGRAEQLAAELKDAHSKIAVLTEERDSMGVRLEDAETLIQSLKGKSQAKILMADTSVVSDEVEWADTSGVMVVDVVEDDSPVQLSSRNQCDFTRPRRSSSSPSDRVLERCSRGRSPGGQHAIQCPPKPLAQSRSLSREELGIHGSPEGSFSFSPGQSPENDRRVTFASEPVVSEGVSLPPESGNQVAGEHSPRGDSPADPQETSHVQVPDESRDLASDTEASTLTFPSPKENQQAVDHLDGTPRVSEREKIACTNSVFQPNEFGISNVGQKIKT